MDRRLLVLALGMFALGTDSFVVAGVLPEIARSYNVSIGAAGQMTTVYALSLAILAPIIAAVAAHMPRKHLLLSGLAIFVIANLGTAIAPTFEIALATRAFAGLGAAMFSPTATGAAALIVAPERRGFALSVVIAGMTISTALGAPIGTLIGGFADWRWTMVFVAALAVVSGTGVLAFLSHIPMPPAVSLAKRLAPLADVRVGYTLATTFLFFSGAYTLYTYFSVVFGRTTGGNPALLSGLLVIWGVAGTASNLLIGRLTDGVGNRRVLVALLICLIANFVLMPWTSATVLTSIIAIALWGACGWGMLVPQQHRLVGIAPSIAPILLGLNNSATFLGTTVGSVVGAAGIGWVGGNKLGYIAAAFALAALIAAELAARKITAFERSVSTSEGKIIASPAQSKA